MHRVWAFALLTACYQPGTFDQRDSGSGMDADAADVDAPPDGFLDGCPTNYQVAGAGRYRLDTTERFWFAAQDACALDQQTTAAPLIRTHLAIITSREELEAVGMISTTAFWVGYTDLDTEGAWHHITTESSDYPGSSKGDDADDPWNIGEPNGSTNENCAIIFSGAGAPKFDDRPCNNGTTMFFALCECDANEAMLPGG